ncbi:MAG: hypothetical protein HYZ53_24910 [Planctomycetes bacterium]|nr:hypothetical protein [Planctomycetota bacterium]
MIDESIDLRCLLFDGRAVGAKRLWSDQDRGLARFKLTEPSNAAGPGGGAKKKKWVARNSDAIAVAAKLWWVEKCSLSASWQPSRAG